MHLYTCAVKWRAGVTLVLCSVVLLSRTTPETNDVVQKLMPDGTPPRIIRLSAAERTTAVKELEQAQRRATGMRSQDIAFLLAALDSDYPRNRAYLVAVLRGCDSRRINNNCDEHTAELLIRLDELGHHDVLQPLLAAGVHSDAAVSELLGTFYGRVLLEHTTEFLDAIRPFSASEQKTICYLAGSADGAGMASKDVSRARHDLKRIGDSVALRCLRQVETANEQ